MKKFIIACSVLFAVALAGVLLYSTHGAILPFVEMDPASIAAPFSQEGRVVYHDAGDGRGPRPFEIRGVDLGAGQPGNFATDYAIDRETYLRWFDQIKAMGANCIRVYTVHGTEFYEAFYEYNEGNPDPLYLIHGVWVDDYANNSHIAGFDDEFLGVFKEDVRTTIDVVHGTRPLQMGRLSGSGTYTRDVSPWVIGYIIGVEWEPPTVLYTNMKYDDRTSFEGRFLRTEDASPFEAMLAEVGDEALLYETERFHEQRLIAFSNWPETDPNEFPDLIKAFFGKYAAVDVEHIHRTERVKSGMFASYHIYPYHPDFLRYIGEYATQTDPSGNVNTYYTYLKLLAEHHSIPLVISEFGVPSARGRASWDQNTYRNQGGMNEHQQALAIAQCFKDIQDAGCAGCMVFSWQDEWFKRSWNTWTNVDLLKSPYWSDCQTNEQSYGLLAFDPGGERSVSYVDGDLEEWTTADVVGEAEGLAVSMKYDEKYVYLMVEGADVGPDTPIYLPIDTTQKTGSKVADPIEGKLPALEFERDADFVLVLDGEENSRLLVQERYEALRATKLLTIAGVDPHSQVPAADTATFKPIYLMIYTLGIQLAEGGDAEYVADLDVNDLDAEHQRFSDVYETGLLAHGNANPESDDFDSLADFIYGDHCVEVRLPWGLLNFSNPSDMQIHDDYYECYGVENFAIDSMWVGVGAGDGPIPLFEAGLRPWGRDVTTHERLKESYYTLQSIWTGERSAEEVLAEAEADGTAIADAKPLELVTYKELYYPDAAVAEPAAAGPIESTDAVADASDYGEG